MLVAGLPSFPNPHQVSTTSISCLPSTRPGPSPRASLRLRTRAAPPHTSVLRTRAASQRLQMRAPSLGLPARRPRNAPPHARESPRLLPSRARGRPDNEAAPPPLVTVRTPRRGRASARGLSAARPDELRLFPGPLASARLPPGCTADDASSGCTASGASLWGLGFAFERSLPSSGERTSEQGGDEKFTSELDETLMGKKVIFTLVRSHLR